MILKQNVLDLWVLLTPVTKQTTIQMHNAGRAQHKPVSVVSKLFDHLAVQLITKYFL